MSSLSYSPARGWPREGQCHPRGCCRADYQATMERWGGAFCRRSRPRVPLPPDVAVRSDRLAAAVGAQPAVGRRRPPEIENMPAAAAPNKRRPKRT
jgi:hypothetical protein